MNKETTRGSTQIYNKDESHMHYKTENAYNNLLVALPRMIELAMNFALECVPEGVELQEPKRRSRRNLAELFNGDHILGDKLFEALPEKYKAEGGASKGL